MKITVSGLEGLGKILDKYANLEAKCLEICKRLCEVGEPIIRATHGNHASIGIMPLKQGYSLNAEGQDILFIEFGTGNATGREAGKYDAVPSVALVPGSWSEAHGGEYAATGGYPNGFWHFGGRRYTETPPHPAFYDAYVAMTEALPQIVAEVFK